ncbi:MAG TPA: RecQ family zinc-binding domain-containing protein [Candidatus Limnocylindrales bacterium]|nr:RecQ family zinc-binding domain-containing protein [Candidatus Limnocylindrales bacterium]
MPCRWAYLLSYLGEVLDSPCGHCDLCAAMEARDDAGPGGPPAAAGWPAAAVDEDGPFAIGARVLHPRWGSGSIVRTDERAISVLFERVGYRDLARDLVESGGLLTPEDEAASDS